MRFIRTTLKLIVSAALVLIIYLYVQSDVTPKKWDPAPLPALEGVFSPSKATSFDAALRIEMPGPGPEDIAKGPDGKLYTGLEDGSIVRFESVVGSSTSVFAKTGGRPLGLQFDRAGNLIVADAYKGLLSVSPQGEITVLVDAIDSQPMKLTDDLDIASDGTIWFTDASQRFDLEHFMKDILEASFTGRLISHNPETGVTRVQLDGLYFANGVALGPDEQFVLVNETGTGRIHRLWLEGERAGEHDLFFDGLPGHPDNLSMDDNGTFWVALPGMRDAARDSVSNSTFLRTLMGGLPIEALTIESTAGFVLGFDAKGNVTHMVYEDPSEFTEITSVNRIGDQLVLGSLHERDVLILPVPTSRSPEP